MAEETTIKQHYVPQFYLKRFADKYNFLQYMDLKYKRLGKSPYPAVCYEEYYYAKRTGEKDQVSQELEIYFRLLEGRIADNMDETCSIIRDVNRTISDKERDILSCLISMLYLRGKYMRAQIAHTIKPIGQKMIDMIKTRREPTEEDKKNYLEFDNTLHLMMQTDILEFSRWFFIKKWKVYLAKGQYLFITTDNPVSEIFPERNNMFGPHICERTHYIAIAPDIMIELTEPMGNRKIKRQSIYPSDNQTIKDLNRICASQAEQFVYSKSIKEIKDILATA